MSLETTFDDGILNKVPEITNDSAVYDFLDALSSLSPDFQANWDARFASEEIPSFKEMLRYYRNYRRNIAARIRNTAFSASLQGYDSDGNPVEKNKPRGRYTPCLCRIEHS